MHASSGRMIATVLKLISVPTLMQFYFPSEAIVWLGPGAVNTSSDFFEGNWCSLLKYAKGQCRIMHCCLLFDFIHGCVYWIHEVMLLILPSG